MASLALGLVGGFFFGPVGYLVGSFIGSLLDPPKQEGPRLQNLRLQVSQYGDMVKDVWGTMRIAGNVIWIGNGGNLVEHKNTSGGKGGPQVTTYTYTASFAVGLCNRPAQRAQAIKGIAQIYADQRLIWGRGVSDDAPSLPITIYYGTEDQAPDPTMQADLGGLDNVPAFRGTAYVVFKDWDLSQFFNRIPNLEFVVFTNAGEIPIRVSTFTTTGFGSGAVTGVTYDGTTITKADYSGGGSPTTPILYKVRHWLLDGTPTGTDINTTAGDGLIYCTVSNLDVASISPDNVTNYWYLAGVQGPRLTGNWPSGPSIGVYQNGYIYTVVADIDGVGGVNGIMRFQAPNGVPIEGPADIITVVSGSAGNFHINGSTDGTVYLYDAGGTGTLYKFDAALALQHSWSLSTWPSIGPGFYRGGGFFYYAPLNIWATDVSTGGSLNPRLNLMQVDASNNVTLYPQARDGTNYPSFGWAGGQIVYLGGGYILGIDGVALLLPPLAGVPLSQIVSDVSDQSGLDTSSQIDVSELTDIVDGFVIDTQMTGRNRIDPLRNAYFFDAVESDAKVKFPKRGRASVVSIPDNDLAAFIKGSQPPAQLQNDRGDGFDLPQQLTVQYVNEGADYQPGSQVAQRQVTDSQSQVSLQLPIAMTDQKAIAVANTILDSTWAEREKYTWYLSREYAYLDPSDVITAKGRNLRIVTREETGTQTIKFEGVQDFSEVYQQAAVSSPAAGMPPVTPPAAAALTDLLLLDIPLVADSDSPQSGFYSAMGPDGGGTWPGATLMKSIDGGVSYASLLVDKQTDTLGACTTVLGAWDPNNNIFDEINSVTVKISTGGTLSGASMAAVINGANMALIGDEILQFKNAVLIADATYTLSGLLRGRRGTEWAMGSHASAERFVLLPVDRADMELSEIFLEREYKGVTAGQAIADATAQSFTNNGNGLTCYSPVQLGGGTDAGGNVALNWNRRTRIGGAWMNNVDVPLSEPSEIYVVSYWDSTYSLCANWTVVTGVQTITYTAAEQASQFGATQKTIYFSVMQLGMVGPGTEARGTAVGSGASNNAPLAPIPPYGS